jgi:hypothetical protein
MNPAWIHAVVLVCVFGAVVLAAESAIRWLASNRSESQAIRWRLKLIGRGGGRSEQTSNLRRTESSVPAGLPPALDRFAHNLDQALVGAGQRLGCLCSLSASIGSRRTSPA